MAENFLVKLFEHNHWANLQILQTCAALSEAQLDAQPSTTTLGTIRQTLIHLVGAQRGYLALLTVPVSERPRSPVEYTRLMESAQASGEGLIALVSGAANANFDTRLQTTNGLYVEPWVVILQVINHATEHREQINSMITALGLTPPDLAGWAYGEATKALIPMQ
jgi:uncharacterized damage-inducible protein DinB